jgi:acyl carrier protein
VTEADAALQARVVALVARELGVPEDEISVTSSSEDVERWDSLGHLQICMAIEAEFGVAVELDLVPDLDSVPAIVALVADR